MNILLSSINNVDINDNLNYVTIKCNTTLQNSGIKYNMYLNNSIITINGKSNCINNVRLYIFNDQYEIYSVKYLLNDKISTITYKFEGSGYYNIGIVFPHCNINDSFDIYKFNIDNIILIEPVNENIDVLMLAGNDYANTCLKFRDCMRSIGMSVYAFKCYKHKFNYNIQLPLIYNFKYYKKKYHLKETNPIYKYIERAKIINFHNTSYFKINTKNKIFTVTHGGSIYRGNYRLFNNIFNRIVSDTIIETGDLYNLDSKNPHLIIVPEQCNIVPDYTFKHKDKLVIGHFPSNPEIKGTRKITQAIKHVLKYSNSFNYIGINNNTHKTVTWNEQIKRYKKCDIYIETCNLKLNGKTFGEWGITCKEAALCGCIVITNSLTTDIYKKEYGNCPLYIANNKQDIINSLYKIGKLSREDILQKKMLFRKWVETHHSYKQCGKKI